MKLSWTLKQQISHERHLVQGWDEVYGCPVCMDRKAKQLAEKLDQDAQDVAEFGPPDGYLPDGTPVWDA